MPRIILILFIVISNYAVQSQTLSYKDVNDTTYTLYTNKDWKKLTQFGEENSLDFYYFNIRMGIAYYNLKKYFSAEEYFLKAINNNNIDLPKTYLYWTYINLGEDFLAEKTYNQLSPDAKRTINDKKTFIESIYLELGVKNPSLETLNNTYYQSVGLTNRIGNNIKLSQTFNHSSQNTTGLDYISNQYHVFGRYLFKNTSIGAGALFAKNTINENDFEIENDTEGVVLIEYNNALVLKPQSYYINFYKRFNRLKFVANINYLRQCYKTTESTTNTPQSPPGFMQPPSTTSTIITETSSSTITPSLMLVYTPKLFGDCVAFGAESFLTFDENQTYFTIKPILNLVFTEKFWINTYYINVKDFLFFDYSNNILYNTPDLSINRFSGTINYAFSNKTIINMSYINEQFAFSSLDINYAVNSLFLGLQLKF